jgi:hypothetical protein
MSLLPPLLMSLPEGKGGDVVNERSLRHLSADLRRFYRRIVAFTSTVS